MKEAQYRISIKRIRSLLRKLALSKGVSPGYIISTKDMVRFSTLSEYIAAYKKAIETLKYDILLFDDSIMQFSYSRGEDSHPLIRYTYYQFPFDFPTYEEYLDRNEMTYEEAGELFRDEYEQELSEVSSKAYLTPIRYDYNVDQYTCGIHPASHIHIGYMNSIRIPVCMILTPYMFALFVIKQCYYNKWMKLIGDTKFMKSLNTSKTSCLALTTELFGNLDKKELYLV